jgi:hypothetical protein
MWIFNFFKDKQLESLGVPTSNTIPKNVPKRIENLETKIIPKGTILYRAVPIGKICDYSHDRIKTSKIKCINTKKLEYILDFIQ